MIHFGDISCRKKFFHKWKYRQISIRLYDVTNDITSISNIRYIPKVKHSNLVFNLIGSYSLLLRCFREYLATYKQTIKKELMLLPAQTVYSVTTIISRRETRLVQTFVGHYGSSSVIGRRYSVKAYARPSG